MYNKSMLRHTAALLILLCFPWQLQAGELQPYDKNLPTPALALQDSGGKTHELSDYHGQVVLLNFWASWCPPCIQEMPVLERLKQKLHDQPFEILAVNVGEQKYRVWKFTKLVGFGLPVLLDTQKDTFELWGGTVLPTSFLLDTQGRIRHRVQGDLEWDSEEMVSLIEALINEEENE